MKDITFFLVELNISRTSRNMNVLNDASELYYVNTVNR